MSIRNSLFNTVTVALGGLALAGLLGTDVYSQAAGAEARGLKALSLQVEMSCDDCPDGDANRLALAPNRSQP
ncbi:hypothetical protein [Telluria aromaticivorans]|uniref:Uncharacterized protein n=1 Tax=Telluria aromaticivorans TaxID=2725995 RepID=A0A7Y2K295_9BURK|nr:hypothetical protein [Telluria aromaticivorans]NNG25267.1 hypothetical protein [Telluria aromaticivorans]